MFFQECSERFLSGAPSNLQVLFKKVPTLSSGVAIVANNVPMTDVPFPDFPGRVAIAKIPYKNKEMCLINIHNFQIGITKDRSDEYRASLQSMLDKLSGTIISNKECLVFGGDMNVWLLCDRTKKYSKHDKSGDRVLLDKITSLGLTNFSDKEVGTHIKKSREFPNDYLFTSGCRLLNHKIFDIPNYANSDRPVSDHKPLLIEID